MNTSPQFNLALARELAEFSHLAYAAVGTGALVDPMTDTKAILGTAADGSYIKVGFRGTSNIRNWLIDLDVKKHPIELGVRVHDGFCRATEALLPLIVDKLRPPEKSLPLVITGHSLGGAVAALAAFFLQREGYQIRSVYTFASPRAGNAIWRDTYNQILGAQTFRVACVGDLVPLLPGIFTTFADGYRHVGREVLLHSDRYQVEPSRYIEMAEDGLDAYLAIRRRQIDYVLARHSITGDYIATLDAIAEAWAETHEL